jgi:hypothetical protein
MTDQQTSTPTTNNLPKDPALENAIEDICRYAVKWKRGKQTDDQIQKRLVDAGLSIADARAVTVLGLAPLGKNRRTGMRHLLFGALWFALGSILTLAMSEPSLVAYGLILLGLLQVLFGLIRIRQAPQGMAEIREVVRRIAPTIPAEETSHWKIAAVKIHNP